jgi:hypothetical protein
MTEYDRSLTYQFGFYFGADTEGMVPQDFHEKLGTDQIPL